MEFYKHRLIEYSLGDFANYHNFSSAGTLSRSVVLRVTLNARGAYVSGELTSIRLAAGGRASVGGDSLGFVSSLSRHDFGSHAARIRKNGEVLAPR
jgi:hypothetical protein